MIYRKELLVAIAKLFLLGVMLFALANFGTPYVKLENLGDLNVDVAFQLALPYFLEEHLQYGEQVVFTYGPWGILMSPFTGPSWRIAALVFRVTLVICVFLAICVLADRGRNRWSRIYIWSGSIVMVMLWATGHRDSYFLIPALLVAFQRWANEIIANDNINSALHNAEKLLWIAMSLLSGWLALAKFNIFIVSSVAFILILAGDLKKQRWPILPFTFFVSLLTAWTLAGQELSNLPTWVMRCLDLSTGYADAMSKGFFIPYGVGVVAAFYSAVALIILAGGAGAALHRWTQPALLSLLLTTILCFVAVKHGMGGNQLEQALSLLVAVLWFVGQLLHMALSRHSVSRKSPWVRVALINIVAAFLLLAVVAGNINFPIRNPREVLIDMRVNASQLMRTLEGDSTDEWEKTLLKAHRLWPFTLMPVKKTIDVYPHHTGIVIGREGLHYTPRPAFLSLNAHTYELALLNARHLDTSTAPDLILLQVPPVVEAAKNRYPTMADGPSWPRLISNYYPESITNDFLLLKKRKQALVFNRKLLLDTNLRFGETLLLPGDSGNLLWIEIEIERTIFGKIIHALYKSPHIMIENSTSISAKTDFQIIPELSKAGFIISPFIQSNIELAEIIDDIQKQNNAVNKIKILSPEAPDFFWDKTIKLRLWSFNN